MQQSEVVRLVASREKLPIKLVRRVVDAFLDTIGMCLAVGETVQLKRFGKFEVTELKPVTRINPRTGKTMDIDARAIVRFKQGATLKRRVNTV